MGALLLTRISNNDIIVNMKSQESQPFQAGEKMKIIVNSLDANPRVVLWGGFERYQPVADGLPLISGYFGHTLDLFTYPVDPTYKPKDLDDFMMGLIPELKPTSVDHFRQYGSDLSLGKLYYDELIGRTALGSTAQSDGYKTRTWVNVFPDFNHLTDAVDGINRYNIPKRRLGRSKGSPALNMNAFRAPILDKIIKIDNLSN